MDRWVGDGGVDDGQTDKWMDGWADASSPDGWNPLPKRHCEVLGGSGSAGAARRHGALSCAPVGPAGPLCTARCAAEEEADGPRQPRRESRLVMGAAHTQTRGAGDK